MTIRNMVFVSILCLLTTACLAKHPPKQAVSSFQPTPAALHVSVSPTLPSLNSALRSCAQLQGTIEIIPYPSSPPGSESQDRDLLLWWGPGRWASHLRSDDYTTHQIGLVEASPVVHKDLGLDALHLSTLSSIFRGNIQNWAQVSPELGDQPIAPMSYPPAHPLRMVMEEAFLEPGELSPNTIVAPDVTAMLELMERKSGSVGLLPSPAVPPSLVEISLTPPHPPLHHPVLAITPNQDLNRVLPVIGCLQNSFNP